MQCEPNTCNYNPLLQNETLYIDAVPVYMYIYIPNKRRQKNKIVLNNILPILKACCCLLQHHLTLSVLQLICRCVFHDCVFLFLVWFKKNTRPLQKKIADVDVNYSKKRIIDSIVSFISLNYTCLWLYHKISLLKCLLGSKYGKCPLPNYLDEAEFTHIRNEAFEGGKGG